MGCLHLLAFQLTGLPACTLASQLPPSCIQHRLLPRQCSSTDRQALTIYLQPQLLSADFTPELCCTELCDPTDGKKLACQMLSLDREWMLLPSFPKTQKWPILQQHHTWVQIVNTSPTQMQDRRMKCKRKAEKWGVWKAASKSKAPSLAS